MALRRTGIRRKGTLARSKPLRRISKRRAGLSTEQRRRLKRLHRWAVMLRYGKAYVVQDGKTESWWGPCPICTRDNWLQCCHIMPQGRFPHMAFDEDNAFPACALCHIYKWHKDPLWATPWITARIGDELARLQFRSRIKQPIDFALRELALLADIRQRDPSFERTPCTDTAADTD